jgi:hypothetical protein
MRPVDNIRQMWGSVSSATANVAQKGCRLAHCFCEKVRKEAVKLFNEILPPRKQEQIKSQFRVLRQQIGDSVTDLAQSTQKKIDKSVKLLSSRMKPIVANVQNALTHIKEKVQKTFSGCLDVLIPSRIEARTLRGQVNRLMVQLINSQNLAEGFSCDGATQKERADRIEAEAHKALEHSSKSSSDAERDLLARAEKAEEEAKKALGLVHTAQADAEALKARAEKAEAEAISNGSAARITEHDLEIARGRIADLLREKEVVEPAHRDPSPMPPALGDEDGRDVLPPAPEAVEDQEPQQAPAEDDVRSAAQASTHRRPRHHMRSSGSKTPSLKVCLQGTGYPKKRHS